MAHKRGTSGRAVLGAVSLLLIVGCGSDDRVDEDQLVDELADARAEARADLAASSYELESFAYGCTSDCSGHEAGWQYAADNGSEDTGDCFGNSLSFEEGCRAFVEEVEARAQQAVTSLY